LALRRTTAVILTVLLCTTGIPDAFALAASYVIGQDDGTVSAPLPIYTKGTAQNAAHKLGLSLASLTAGGIVMDTTDHRLFVTDTGNHRVLVYGLDAGNALVDRIPDNVIGQLNFYANSTGQTQSTLSLPLGLEYDDTNNRLFVVGSAANRVTVYDVTSITDGENAINVLGQPSFTTSSAATTQEGLNAPVSLAYDSTNNRLFVAQTTGNRVSVFDITAIYDGEPAVSVLGQANFTTATAATTQAGMNVPYDVALSGSTTLFVSQGTGHRVTAYNIGDGITDGENAIKVLGQANFTATALGNTQVGMNAPRGLAYNSVNKMLYVSQTTGNRVTVYNLGDGITDGENAVSVLGQSVFTVITAATTQAGLSSPAGLYVDRANSKLYVLQAGSNRLSIFDVASITNGENAVDLLGQTDDSLTAPSPIYTKSTANNASYKMGLSAPFGLTVDSTYHRLFVVDSSNNRVLVYNLTADNILEDTVPDNVLGQAFFYTNATGVTQSTLSAPNAAGFDPAGNRLFVSDGTNNRILVFDTASITDGENAVGVLGQANYTTATSGSSQANLSAPRQPVYDTTSGQLFVADQSNNRVVIYDATTITDGEHAMNIIGQDDGTVSAPEPIYTKGTINNGPHKLGLSSPTAVSMVVDTVDHRLFVADTGNSRVLVYNMDSNNVLLDRTPDSVIGQPNFYSNATTNTRAITRSPAGLAYDFTGKRLFVAEISNRVTVYDVATIVNGEEAVNVLGQTSFTVQNPLTTQAGMNVPNGIAYDDATDKLYVSQTTGNRVTVYDLSAGYADYMNAENLLGQYDDSLSAPGPIYTKSTAHNGPNKLGMSAPSLGIAMDTTDHRLFISDTSNNRVLVYNLDSGNTLIDRIPDNVLGQLNFYTGTVAITQAGFQGPMGLAYDDAQNRLFVADQSNARVMVFDATSITNGENAINLLGQATFTTNAAATTQVGLNQPVDVAYDSANSRLFVSQATGANRVTVYNFADGISNGESATGVLGQSTFTATTAATTQAGMNLPYGIALSGSTLFVTQTSGNRVTAYNLADGITNGENAVNVLGQANFTGTAVADTQSGMRAPRGVSYDSATKTLYVAQFSGNRVTTYDLGNGITDGENAVNVLGQSLFTTLTAASTQPGLNVPYGILIDSANSRLYVSQSTGNRVSIFDVASITNGENAVDLLGQYDDDLVTPGPIYTKSVAHNGPNIHGLSLSIASYGAVELDSTNHRLFLSDTGNNRVLMYNLDSDDQLLDNLPDGVLGQANFYTNTAATTQSGLSLPHGLAFDSANNRLFVGERNGNHRVVAYDVTSITNGENAINVLGQANFTSATAATTQAGMNLPLGIEYNSATSQLFVAQDFANRVTVYDVASITDGENAVAVLGQTTFTGTSAGTTQAAMSGPYDVALSGSTLFVAITGSNRVNLYDIASITNGENAINTLGQANFTATTAASTQAGMNVPRNVAYDGINKRLYVAQDTARVTVYDVATVTDGENAVNVIGQPSFTTITPLADQHGLTSPSGIEIDGAHNRLYVVDATINRVLSYNTQVGIGNGENAVSVLGQSDFTTTTAATTQAGMNIPYDVTLSGSTTLFVSQGTGNRVTAYNIGDGITNGENAIKVLGQATFTATALGNTQVGMNAPRGIAYNPVTKTLFVSQTTGNRITTYNLGDGITDGENAVNVLGQPSFIVISALVTQPGLSAPNGLSIDTTNNKLYVLQSGAHRVSVFDIATITNGEAAVDVLGQSDNDLNPPGPIYTKGTANNAAYKMGLSAPQGVALDRTNHRLFVADTNNNRVLLYNLTAGNVLIDTQPDAVLGQPAFWSNAAGVTQTGLSAPVSLAFDPVHNELYVADFSGNRIIVYDTASVVDGENAVDLIGQSSFIVSTATTTQTGLSGPRQIDYDTVSGQLFVSESGNHRVVIYTINPPSDAPSGGGDEFHFFGF